MTEWLAHGCGTEILWIKFWDAMPHAFVIRQWACVCVFKRQSLISTPCTMPRHVGSNAGIIEILCIVCLVFTDDCLRQSNGLTNDFGIPMNVRCTMCVAYFRHEISLDCILHISLCVLRTAETNEWIVFNRNASGLVVPTKFFPASRRYAQKRDPWFKFALLIHSRVSSDGNISFLFQARLNQLRKTKRKSI